MTIKEYIEMLKETYNEAKASLLMMLPLFILLIAVLFCAYGFSLSGLVKIVGGVFLGMSLALLFLYYEFYIYDKL